MVTLLSPIPTAPRLYAAAGDPSKIRLVVYLATSGGPPLTLSEAWVRPDARVLLLPEVHDADQSWWTKLEAGGAAWNSRRFVWIKPNGGNAHGVGVTADNLVEFCDLPVSPTGEMAFKIPVGCPFRLASDRDIAQILGPIQLRITGATAVDLQQTFGRGTVEIDLGTGDIFFELAVDHTNVEHLHADIRFFTRGAVDLGHNHAVDPLRYPLLAPREGETISLVGRFVPSALVRALRLDFKVNDKKETTPFRTNLQTHHGEHLYLSSQGGFLATQPWPKQLASDNSISRSDLYFAFEDSFVIEPPPSQLLGNATPLRLLTGLAGTEYIDLPDFSTDPAVRKISFELGSAMVLEPPWFAKATNQQGASPLSEIGRTSWLKVDDRARIWSQSQRAPLFEAAVNGVHAHAPTQISDRVSEALPITPMAGLRALSAAPTRDPYVLAAQRIAPARLTKALAFRRPTTSRLDATTPQGFIATTKGGRWTNVKLATGGLVVRDEQGNARRDKVEVDINLPVDSRLADGLLQPEVILATNRWEDVSQMAKAATLAAEQWGFHLNLAAPGATDFDPLGGITFFKFNTRTLEEVIADLHTYREKLTSSPEPARALVIGLIKDLEQNRPAYFAHLKSILRDPKWTGIVTFNATISQPPTELAGLIGTTKGLRALYLAVPLNRVNGELQQRDALVSGVINYQNKLPLDKSSDYDLKVQEMRVMFVSNAVTKFECAVELFAKKMFFEHTDIKDHPDNTIRFDGRYEAHGPMGGPTYLFETKPGETFKFSPANASVIKEMVIDRLKFVTESSTVDAAANKKTIRSRIGIRGSIAFGDAISHFDIADLFSFKELRFDDLALQLQMSMKANETTAARFDSIDFHAGGISFDVKATARAGSLLNKLPLKLKGLIAQVSETDLGDLFATRGFFEMGSAGFAKPRFALLFEFDLGSLGGLANGAKGLKLDFALGWRANLPALGIRLPELSGERAIGIEGVLRIIAKNLIFKRSPKGAILLALQDAQLEILGQRFPGDDNNDKPSGLVISDGGHSKPAWLVTKSWDSKKQFVGLGQSLALQPKQSSASGAIGELAKIFDAMERDPDVADKILTGGGTVAYAADHDWLFALRLTIKTFLGIDLGPGSEIGIVLNDPSLYGLYVSLLGLHFDLLYRRVSDGVGMFHIEAPLPIPPIKAGLMTFTPPDIGLSVFTDGGIKVNLGYPENMDFAHSAHLDLPPYGGAGGFYFALFRTAGSDLLPAGAYAMIWQAGLGLRVGYSVKLAFGPFTASASISVYAMLEGALGFYKQMSDPPDIAVRGRLGIMVALSAHLDFAITSLDFDLEIWAGIEVLLQIIKQQLLPIKVAFEVGVRVRLRWVIARFRIFGKRIEIAITLSFERTFRYETTLGGGPEANLFQAAHAYVARLAAVGAWRQTITSLDPTPAITLHFHPETTIGSTGAVNLIALLAISRSSGDAAAPAWTAFDELLREVIRWAARTDAVAHGQAATGPFKLTKAQLVDWRTRLAPAHSTAQSGLLYEVIVEFLARRTILSFADHPDAKTDLAFFPMFTDLGLVVTSGDHPGSYLFDKSPYSEADVKRLDDMLRPGNDLQGRQISPIRPPAPSMNGTVPLAALLMQDYFESLVKLAVTDLVSVASDVAEDLEILIQKLRNRAKGEGGDAFAVIASNASAQLLNAQHIPPPSATPFTGPSVYERTGQLVQIFDAVPTAFPGDVTIALARGNTQLVTRTMDEAVGYAALRHLSDLLQSADVPPHLSGDSPVRTVRYDDRRPLSFELASYATLAVPMASNVSLVLDFPADLVKRLRGARSLALRPRATFVTTHEERPIKPIELVDGRWLMKVELEIRHPGAQVAETFEVLGMSDATRRLVERWFDDGGSGQLSVFRSVAGGSGEPPVLHEIAAASQILCVMTNTARRANPASLLHLMVSGTATTTELISASAATPVDFMRLMWSASIVRDGGFTLVLPIPATSITWTQAGRATLVIHVDLGPVTGDVPSCANAVAVAKATPPASVSTTNPRTAVARVGYALHPADGATDASLTKWSALARPGRLTVELHRPDPERQHPGIPAFAVESGRAAVDHVLADGPGAELVEEATDKLVVQQSYRFLSLRIANDASEGAAYRRPASPRALDAVQDMPKLALLAETNNAEADDWIYRTVIDLTTLFPKKSGLYDLVGQNLDIAFAWRDAFGNDAPDWVANRWRWKQTLRVTYLDRLVPVSEWPRVTAKWTPQAKDGRLLDLELTYGPGPISDVEHKHWALIRAQILDGLTELASNVLAGTPRVQIEIRPSFAAGIHIVPLDDRKKLLEFIDRINSAPMTSDHVSLAVPLIARATKDSRTRIDVAVRFERNKDFVEVAMPPEVQCVDGFAVADLSDGLSTFAEKFDAYRDLCLAFGEAEEGSGEHTLWSIPTAMLDVAVKTTLPKAHQWARFFAPTPLSTQLVSFDGAVTPVFVDASKPIDEVSLSLRGLDVDVLLRKFLDDLEACLRIDAFVPARKLANASDIVFLDSIVGHKLKIATTLGKLVQPLFAAQDDHNGLDEAVNAFIEAARKDLRKVYGIDSIAQMDVENTSRWSPDVAEQLYGTVRATASSAPVGLSQGRIWACPGATTSSLTLTVDDLTNQGRGSVDASLTLDITHLAQPDSGSCNQDPSKYQRMRWLQFAKPRPLELGPASPALRIPMPVRYRPRAPTLSGQSAVPVELTDELNDARGWNFNVTYSLDDPRGTDCVLATVRYQRYAVPSLRTLDVDAAKPHQLLAAVLSGWGRSASAVLTLVEAARAAPPTTPTADVFAAYRYVARVVAEVSKLLEAHFAGAKLLALGQNEVVDEIDMPATQDGTIQQGGRTYEFSGARDSTRKLATRSNLDILSLTAATTELRMVRNQILLPLPGDGCTSGTWKSRDAFIYTTESVAAGDWIQPVLAPERLYAAPNVPAKGDGRIRGIQIALERWLHALASSGPVDVSLVASHAFDPTGGTINEITHLGNCCVVPLLFISEWVIDSGTPMDAISKAIHERLPQTNQATGAGVLLDVTAFTHDGDVTRAVLRLRGLWIPLDSEMH